MRVLHCQHDGVPLFDLELRGQHGLNHGGDQFLQGCEILDYDGVRSGSGHGVGLSSVVKTMSSAATYFCWRYHAVASTTLRGCTIP